MTHIHRDDAEWKEMVYCPIMRTYVPVAFCLNGGPEARKGPCSRFVEIKTYPPAQPGAEPVWEIVHDIRTTHRIERHIAMKGEGDS
jgi:hypothetical protein